MTVNCCIPLLQFLLFTILAITIPTIILSLLLKYYKHFYHSSVVVVLFVVVVAFLSRLWSSNQTSPTALISSGW